jgi:hypothetical protein
MAGFRMFETTDLIFAGKPFKLLRIDDDITGMRATGEFATA